jgi:hypothetical protein
MRASTKPDLAIMSLQDEHYQQGTSSRRRILQHCTFVIITSLPISSLYPILSATILLPYYLAVFLYLLFLTSFNTSSKYAFIVSYDCSMSLDLLSDSINSSVFLLTSLFKVLFHFIRNTIKT